MSATRLTVHCLRDKGSLFLEIPILDRWQLLHPARFILQSSPGNQLKSSPLPPLQPFTAGLLLSPDPSPSQAFSFCIHKSARRLPGKMYTIRLLLCVSYFFHEAIGVKPSCNSDIYCKGELLHTVQMAKLFPDSKTFVDKKMRFPPKQVLENFNNTFYPFKENGKKAPKELIRKFVDSNFEDGKELMEWSPSDWSPHPLVLNNIADLNLRKWASELNGIWKNLSRKVVEDVIDHPDMYSLMYVPNGFIIPGGRFKELYYWDTYWIVNGLLICDMVKTARGVIENLLYLVSKLGHVPNGSRVYYTERAQPPMLTLMVEAYFKHTGDFSFIRKNIELLDKEMDFWLDNRLINIEKDGVTYSLFRYFAPSTGPRPESYREDYETAANETNDDDRFMKYVALKSSAESGWDFSTRWFIKNGSNDGNLSNIMTQNIIPVDLNALLHKNFILLSNWHTMLENKAKAMRYYRLSNMVLRGIEGVLWSNDEGIWLDYDILNEKPRPYFYMSNFVPLWTKSHTLRPAKLTKYVMNYIEKFNIMSYPGGTPTSVQFSGEQWDFPNAWPPLQAFFIQGLDRIGSPLASEAAYMFAHRYLLSNYKGFQDFGTMFEKYDALIPGRTGGGGEYDGQEGFGWTNGVVFEFLQRWGPRLKLYSKV